MKVVSVAVIFFYSKQKNHLKMQTSYKILADKTWSVITQAYALAQIVSPCVKPSYHHILERSPFAIPSAPSHLQSLSSGSLAIHLFQATISQTKQQKKPPTSLQMHHFPNFEAFIETSNRLPTEEMTFSLLAYGLVINLL